MSMQELKVITEKLNLLYVEDDVDMGLKTLEILKSLFNVVDFKTDGEEGLSAYSENNYDLVITDINLPKLNGIAMCKKILNLNPDQKIIITTAYNDTYILKDLIDVGVSGYLEKPLREGELIAIITKVSNAINLKKLDK